MERGKVVDLEKEGNREVEKLSKARHRREGGGKRGSVLCGAGIWRILEVRERKMGHTTES